MNITKNSRREDFSVAKIFCASMPDWFCFSASLIFFGSASKTAHSAVKLTGSSISIKRQS